MAWVYVRDIVTFLVSCPNQVILLQFEIQVLIFIHTKFQTISISVAHRIILLNFDAGHVFFLFVAMLNVLIWFHRFLLSALIVEFVPICFAWIRNSISMSVSVCVSVSSSRASLASKGEQSLTINVLIFIKFDFNWNDNWNILLLVNYTVIYAITYISSPVTSDTIIC